MAEAEKEKWFVLNALLSPEELTRLTWEEWKKENGSINTKILIKKTYLLWK